MKLHYFSFFSFSFFGREGGVRGGKKEGGSNQKEEGTFRNQQFSSSSTESFYSDMKISLKTN